MKLKPYIRISLLAVFVIVGIILVLSSKSNVETIDNEILKEHNKSILAYEIIDMEKDMTKAIIDMIIKSDTMLSKTEANLQTYLNDQIPSRISSLSEVVSDDEEKQLVEKIIALRTDLKPIQSKLLKLLEAESGTAEVILYYSDMVNLQESYYPLLKELIEISNTKVKESVEAAYNSASTLNIIAYIVVILGGSIILVLISEQFLNRKST